jgi:hypothetical protein
MQKRASVTEDVIVAEPPRVEIQTWNIDRFIPYESQPRAEE